MTNEEPDNKKENRSELTHFLKTRRARLSPAQVSLPSIGRRRTPGLRREDVAQLTGVSTTWYTWLEQGRDISVSIDVLENLVRALHLNEDERAHLFILAGKSLPSTPYPFTEEIPPIFRELLPILEPCPTHIRGRRWDVLAWNHAETVCYTDWDALPSIDRNLIWNHFTNLTLRHRLTDWEGDGRKILALFRMENGDHLETPWFQNLIGRLQASSPEFRQMWPEHEVLQWREDPMEMLHPQLGHLMLHRLAMAINQQNANLTLRVLMPEPAAETITRLRTFLKQFPQ